MSLSSISQYNCIANILFFPSNILGWMSRIDEPLIMQKGKNDSQGMMDFLKKQRALESLSVKAKSDLELLALFFYLFQREIDP